MSFDFLRIIALMPVRDFPRNTEDEKKRHKAFNYAYLVFSIILVALLIVYKAEEVQSMSGLGDLLAWAVGAVIVLWIFGLLIQMCQNLSISYHSAPSEEPEPVISKTGRRVMPRVDPGVSPLKDDIAEEALKAFFIEKGGRLSMTDGWYILNGLLSLRDYYLKEEYEKKSLANWLYSSFVGHFRDFKPVSMTTPNQTSAEDQEIITNLLKEKYFEKKKKN